MIFVITVTNGKLFRSWEKPILTDGKIFANSYYVCNYQKTQNFSLVTRRVTRHISNWMGVQTNKTSPPNQLIIQIGTLQNHCILSKVTVWCAISKYHIIGSFFSENKNGCTVGVNSEWYENTLKIFFLELKRHRVDQE